MWFLAVTAGEGLAAAYARRFNTGHAGHSHALGPAPTLTAIVFIQSGRIVPDLVAPALRPAAFSEYQTIKVAVGAAELTIKHCDALRCGHDANTAGATARAATGGCITGVRIAALTGTGLACRTLARRTLPVACISTALAARLSARAAAARLRVAA